MREKIVLNEVSDEELEELIDGAVNNLRGNTYEGNVAPIYLAEKSRRNSEKYSMETMNISEQSLSLSKETSKISKRTYKIVIGALLISLAALTFSIVDYYGDKSWKEEQLDALKEIQNNTNVKNK